MIGAEDYLDVSEQQLPCLRVCPLDRALCSACHVYMGEVCCYPRGSFGLRAICAICAANLAYARA